MSSQEETLRNAYEQAKQLHGETSAIAFERLLDLARYYALNVSSNQLLQLSETLSSGFRCLPGEIQPYFAQRLLSSAREFVQRKQVTSAEIFYLPVTRHLSGCSWPYGADTLKEVEALGRALIAQQKLIEAEKLFADFEDGLDGSGLSQAERDNFLSEQCGLIEQAAAVRVRLQLWQPACRTLSMLLETCAPQKRMRIAVDLAKAYAQAGDREGLKQAATRFAHVFASLDNVNDLRSAAQIVSTYIEKGLFETAAELERALLEGAFRLSKMNKNFELDWHWFSSVGQAYASVKEPSLARRFVEDWLALLKRRFGGKSAKYVGAFSEQLAFLKRSKMSVEPSAIIDSLRRLLPLKLKAEQRLAIVRVLRELGADSEAQVLEISQALLEKPNLDVNDLAFLDELINLFDWLKLPDLAQRCAHRCSTIVAGSLTEEQRYLLPFVVQRLTSLKCPRQADDCSFFRELKDALAGRSASQRSLDQIVYSELLRSGRRYEAIGLLKQQLEDVRTLKKDARRIAHVAREYVRLACDTRGIDYDSESEPDLAIVAEVYVLILGGTARRYLAQDAALYRKGVHGKKSEGTTVEFLIERNLFRKLTVTRSCGDSARDEEVVDMLKLLGDEVRNYLPGISGMRFAAAFDHVLRTFRFESIV